jgi:hypothetical protein
MKADKSRLKLARTVAGCQETERPISMGCSDEFQSSAGDLLSSRENETLETCLSAGLF